METTEQKTNRILDLINEVKASYIPMRDGIVLVEPTKEEKEALLKKGALYTGINTTPAEAIYTAIACGPTVETVKVGNKVILKAAKYPVIKIKGKEYLQVEEYTILGIFID